MRKVLILFGLLVMLSSNLVSGQTFDFYNEHLYDQYDNSVNTSLWNAVLGSGGSVSETTSYIQIQSQKTSDTGSWSGNLHTLELPNIEDIQGLNFTLDISVDLQGVPPPNTATASGTVVLKVFGTTLITVSGSCNSACQGPSPLTLTNNSVWTLYRNESDPTKFDYYDDGVFIGTITPSNSNITIETSSALSGQGFSSNTATARGRLGLSYYYLNDRIQLIFPQNASRIGTTTILFNASLNPEPPPSQLNNTNATLYVYNSTGLFYSENNAVLGNVTNYTTWPVTDFIVGENYTWYVEGCFEGTISDCVLSENRTFRYVTNPINLTNPVNGTQIYGTQTFNASLNGTDLSINWTNATIFVYDSEGDLFNLSTNLVSGEDTSTFWNISNLIEPGLWWWFVTGCSATECFDSDPSYLMVNAICIDIDHPDYGDKYLCNAENNLNFEFVIDYFEKNVFPDNSSSKVLTLTSNNTTEFNIASHQYDEVDAFSFHINTSSESYLDNVSIYSVNETTIERTYPGFLNGGEIFINTTRDGLGEYSITDSLGGVDKFVLFYADDIINSTNYQFTFNLNGSAFGNESFYNFDNYDIIDLSQTNAHLVGGVIMANGTDKQEFTFDDFEDGSIDPLKWEVSPDFIDNQPGYSYSSTVRETDGYLRLLLDVSNNGNDISGSIGTFASSNFDTALLNLHSSDNLLFNLTATYSSEADNVGCSGDSQVFVGGELIWTSMFLEDTDAGSNQIESSTANMAFNLSNHNSTAWRAILEGIETSSVFISGSGSCTRTNNWTAGSYIQSGAGCSGASTGDLDNDFFFDINYSDTPFLVANEGNFELQCESIDLDTRVYYLNNTLWKRNNSTVVTKEIAQTDSPVDRVFFNVDFLNYNATQPVASYYLSSNNGSTWELATKNTTHSFASPGQIIRFRADFNFTSGEGSYFNDTGWLDNLNISIPSGYPENITIDLGNDDIIDYSILGALNESNGTIHINLTGSDFDAAKSGFARSGNLLTVPLVLKSDSIGTLTISNISLRYDPNPIVLNSTFIQNYLNTHGSNYTNFTVKLISASSGNITIRNVAYNYAGGNYTIPARIYEVANESNEEFLLLHQFYSRWDYDFVPNFIEHLEFIPLSPTSKNVQPFGQVATTNKSILNLTNYGYGGVSANLSVWLNYTGNITCVNLTMGLTNNKSQGVLLGQNWSYLTNLDYLETTPIYLWADYQCSYSTWRLFDPQIYWRQCYSGAEVCSEELV